ncbi:MAG: hypothetical protein DRJ98_05750 [Thermoprotei archaeon]|nr:MAG: hypothetical protein DRJ98_05750 [Thermoprotei archaeon]RLF15599.1 MAG: hypothetical protein DRN06_05825 [Thermoprotei archaeon]
MVEGAYMFDWSTISTLIAQAFNALEDLINNLLTQTLFKARPELAEQFSGPISLLVSLTALYLLLTFITAAKKTIGIILIIGWALLIVAIVLTTMPSA